MDNNKDNNKDKEKNMGNIKVKDKLKENDVQQLLNARSFNRLTVNL